MEYRVEFHASKPSPRTIPHRVTGARFHSLLDASRRAIVEANAMAIVQSVDVEVRIYDANEQLARKMLAASPFNI